MENEGNIGLVTRKMKIADFQVLGPFITKKSDALVGARNFPHIAN
jgi:hypothetical protein